MNKIKYLSNIVTILLLTTGTAVPMFKTSPQQQKAQPGWFSKLASFVSNYVAAKEEQLWTYGEEKEQSSRKMHSAELFTQVIKDDERESNMQESPNNGSVSVTAPANTPNNETTGSIQVQSNTQASNESTGDRTTIKPEQNSNARVHKNTYNNNNKSQPIDRKNKSPKSKSTQSPTLPNQNNTGNTIKKPYVWYYVLGGALFSTGAALVYKAISYMLLTGVKSNLQLLDTLIDAAGTMNSTEFAQFYENNRNGLTALLPIEKSLLEHLLPEKAKFIERAKHIKQDLAQRSQDSGLFSRLGYGLRHDVKTAQGWSSRARTAIMAKLGRIFRRN